MCAPAAETSNMECEYPYKVCHPKCVSTILGKIDIFCEGNLGVKLPTIWTNEKQRWEESEKRRKETPNRCSPKPK